MRERNCVSSADDGRGYTVELRVTIWQRVSVAERQPVGLPQRVSMRERNCVSAANNRRGYTVKLIIR